MHRLTLLLSGSLKSKPLKIENNSAPNTNTYFFTLIEPALNNAYSRVQKKAVLKKDSLVY